MQSQQDFCQQRNARNAEIRTYRGGRGMHYNDMAAKRRKKLNAAEEVRTLPFSPPSVTHNKVALRSLAAMKISVHQCPSVAGTCVLSSFSIQHLAFSIFVISRLTKIRTYGLMASVRDKSKFGVGPASTAATAGAAGWGKCTASNGAKPPYQPSRSSNSPVSPLHSPGMSNPAQ